VSAIGESWLTGSQTGSLVPYEPIDPLVPRVLVFPVGLGPSGSVLTTLIGSSFSASIVVPSTVNQGDPALLVNAWPVKPTDGIGILGTSGYPEYVTGSVAVVGPVTVTGSVGFTGPITGSVILAAAPQVLTMDFAAAMGLISGALAESRFGFVTAGTAGPFAVRATQYFEPTGSAIRSLNSSNAGDTAGGPGAQSVNIFGYDGAMNSLSETVVLNGGSPVPTVNAYQFIERMEVASVGLSGTNLGPIILHQDASGNGKIGTIGFGNQVAGIGDNQTFWAHHYVRSGKTCYIRGLGFDFSGPTNGFILGKVATPLITGSSELQRTGQFGAKFLGIAQNLNVPYSIPGQSKFTMYSVNTVGVQVAAAFEYLEF
jgi:hypothetical protein